MFGIVLCTMPLICSVMTIIEKEIKEDFARFIRHEAMRANCSQDEIRRIINGEDK